MVPPRRGPDAPQDHVGQPPGPPTSTTLTTLDTTHPRPHRPPPLSRHDLSAFAARTNTVPPRVVGSAAHRLARQNPPGRIRSARGAPRAQRLAHENGSHHHDETIQIG
ncbi:hypothetical protein UK82_10400 [Frankia sp. ACN1ag]|nr:hypothetical protein UK82_10400 [Frankia sp. ACN1ag]